ncbi:MAG: hypothetical protein OEM02_01255 [Desulfobulbaceae bacterium]|nr:hypothetical protein [Desulfobulbaceae bacterium]
MPPEYWPISLTMIPALALIIHYQRQQSKIKEQHTQKGIIFLFTFGIITSTYGVYLGIKQEIAKAASQNLSQQMVTIYGQDGQFNALLLISAGIGMIFIGLIVLNLATMEHSEQE